MSVSLPDPSSRLVRAAAAELESLARHRDRLAVDRQKLLEDLRSVDAALETVDERMETLGRLVGPTDVAFAGRRPGPTSAVATRAAPDGAGAETAECSILRGPAIREVAVQVLLAQPTRIEALHYRRWYELLHAAGYGVAGKDPLAVFLTQVTRSPVVRKAGQPGVYEVDRQAPLRIRQRLEKLQLELREATLDSTATPDLASVRARRHELDLAISQQERALEEALRALRPQVSETATAGSTR